MINSRKLFLLFLMVVFINLTPAFAVQMEQVANEAQQYNEQSQKKMGFFSKIKFMAKGYKLIDKAKNAKNESNNENKSSDGEEYAKLWNQDQLNKLQQQKLLNFRNNDKKLFFNSKTNRSSVNNTNDTNATNDTSNQTAFTPNISEICPELHTDAQNMIQILHESGIDVCQSVQTDIDTVTLRGNIVQLIDEKGNIRYAYVEMISPDSKEVNLLTDENKELTMSLDEFEKAYTGIMLSVTSNQDHRTVMGKIIQIQKSNLETEKNDVLLAKKNAKSGIILASILIGVGLILAVVGILLATFMGKALGARVSEAIGKSPVEYIRSGQFRYQISLKTLNAWNLEPRATGLPVFETIQSFAEVCMARFPGDMAQASFAVIDLLAEQEIQIFFWSSSEVTMHVLAQNWLKVIICLVGLIIALVGIGLMIYAIYTLICHVMDILSTNEELNTIEGKINDLNDWLNRSEVTPIIPQNGSNITLNEKTEDINLLQNCGGNKTASV